MEIVVTLLDVERRLEDQIRNLCHQLIAAEDGTPEFQALANNLRASLSAHIERFRSRLTNYPVASERRVRERPV